MIKMSELSLAAWVRHLIMQKPDLTLEQLQEEFDKSGRPAKVRPTIKQAIYLQNNAIKRRWGIVDLAELPRNKDGSLNVAGLVRLYINKFGVNSTEKKAKAFFAVDGIELKTGSFGNAKTAYLRKKGIFDPNAGSGPRARFEAKKSRKSSRKSSRAKSPETEVTFDLLFQTKEYIKQVGGVNQARTLMNLIEEIQAIG